VKNEIVMDELNVFYKSKKIEHKMTMGHSISQTKTPPKSPETI
jgi:hypothetical protein